MYGKRFRLLLAAAALLLIAGCDRGTPDVQDLLRAKSAKGEKTKKVIFLMTDSLMPQAIDEGVRKRELPAFRFLIERGQYYKDLVSSFPTMSVSIDSSLLTGKYPDEHRVPGLVWYSAAERKIVNYGTGPMEVLKLGVDPVLADALVRLNGSHLNPKLPTIYEDLARLGYKSGSINGIIYRGRTEHVLSIPKWMNVPTALPETVRVKGPDLLTLGTLSNPFEGEENVPGDGVANKLGFGHDFAFGAVRHLIRTGRLPDFLFVYLPELDRELHKDGPPGLEGVKKLDGQLMALLQAFGSPEKALEEAVIVVAGDSGMTQILPAGQNSEIDLPALLRDYRVLRTGEDVSAETEIVLAVNETMAYVYNLGSGRKSGDIAEALRREPRIDFVAWKEREWIRVVQGGTGRQLRYKAGGTLVDRYRQAWTVELDAKVLDLKTDASRHSLEYGYYPDVLRQLSAALHSHEGDYLVVTAKPGYELADESSPTHEGGGGHGSVGKTESLVPLLIAGTERKPQYLRMVDLKPYLIRLVTGQDGAIDKRLE
ncbi:alkaline phosphatase family protein [Cohnella massiliensis]|uniref:alkaline phosphatase family protein n=1 Tax=Cohnella massiliensis TaxID=1816691 RepID=UPI0009BC0EC2|nr:alkaline phosphatase family protein [Cohnella massiliensis]